MNKFLEKIEVLGWDLDGTLYPSDREMTVEINRWQEIELGKKYGGDKQKGKREFAAKLKELGSHTKAMEAMGIEGEKFFVEVWDKMDLGKYIKKDPKIISLFENLVDKRHFLLSNSNTVRQMKEKLRLVGLKSEVFEQLVSTVEVGKVKPDPTPFKEALFRMGIKASQKDKVMYVGDRVGTDIKGAKAAGIWACLVGGKSPLADICVKAVYDVEQLFKQLENK